MYDLIVFLLFFLRYHRDAASTRYMQIPRKLLTIENFPSNIFQRVFAFFKRARFTRAVARFKIKIDKDR